MRKSKIFDYERILFCHCKQCNKKTMHIAARSKSRGYFIQCKKCGVKTKPKKKGRKDAR